MELKEFIKTAVTDITQAIYELQSELDNGAVINPTLPNPVTLKTITIDNKIRPIEQLAFDVAVTASESTDIEGAAKAGISIFGARVGTDTSAKTENVSRLSFSIPIVFPSTLIKSPMEVFRENHPKRPKYEENS